MDLLWVLLVALAGGLLAGGLVLVIRARRRARDRANPLLAGQRAARQLSRTARAARRPSKTGTGRAGGHDASAYMGGGSEAALGGMDSGGGPT